MIDFTSGNYHCKLLGAGDFTVSAPRLFANASADELAAALEVHHLNSDGVWFQVDALYVDTGTQRVMIDPGASDRSEQVLTAMQEAGIDPATIDAAIITHAHADHYNGCVHPDGGPAFPNARYYIQRLEWDHWSEPGNPEPHHADSFRDLLLPLRDRFTLLEGDGEILPGFEALGTPGHSPGHMCVVIGGQAVYVGDVLLNPIHIENPCWVAGFDLWPDLVVQSRHALLQKIAAENLLVITHHFGVGHIEPHGDGWRWVAS